MAAAEDERAARVERLRDASHWIAAGRQRPGAGRGARRRGRGRRPRARRPIGGRSSEVSRPPPGWPQRAPTIRRRATNPMSAPAASTATCANADCTTTSTTAAATAIALRGQSGASERTIAASATRTTATATSSRPWSHAAPETSAGADEQREGDERDRRRQREAEPGEDAAERPRPERPDRDADLAARRARQELRQGDEVGVPARRRASGGEPRTRPGSSRGGRSGRRTTSARGGSRPAGLRGGVPAYTCVRRVGRVSAIARISPYPSTGISRARRRCRSGDRGAGQRERFSGLIQAAKYSGAQRRARWNAFWA